MKHKRLGPTAIIDRMMRGDKLTRQIIKGRSTYFFQSDLRPLERDVISRLIAQDIIIPEPDSLPIGEGHNLSQTYRLGKNPLGKAA